MPKGYNADGSKKVRPPESGRKPKPSKQIAPQISLEAATVLTALKKQKINQNTFISEAILEKAEREAARKATKQTEPGNAGQVDLVDMIQEIKTGRVVESIQQADEAEKPLTWAEEIQERIWQAHDRERQELMEWLEMPAVETWQFVQTRLKHYGKKKHKSALFIRISAFMPEPEFKLTWRCHINVVDEKGKEVDYERKASLQYVKEVMFSPDWTATKTGQTTHYLLPINNPIKAQKPKVVKPKTPKPVREKGSGFLIDIYADDNCDSLPEWARPLAGSTEESTELDFDTIHVPAIPTEEFTVQANIVSIEENTPAVFIEDTSEMNKLDYQTERRKTAYAGMLKRVDEFGVGSIGVETVLARIMRIRRRGRVDALEVLTECHNLGLCTNNGIMVIIPGKK